MVVNAVQKPLRAIAYTRVSTAEQAADGHGLDAQLKSATDLIDARGWQLVEATADEGMSGSGKLEKRPEMTRVLETLCEGEADVLVVSELTRLSRSAAELLKVREMMDQCGFALVAPDRDVDTTTSAGRLMFTVLAGVAEFELDETRRRTREGMAAAAAKGVRLGRPVTTPAEIRQRLAELWDSGLSWARCAAALEAEGFNRPGSGKPYGRSGCQKLYASVLLDRQTLN